MNEHDIQYAREHAIAELVRDGYTVDQAHQLVDDVIPATVPEPADPGR
ncbi:MAG TPA: hypothetical protein VFH56_02895 [Acidimicrobiales bacterium]|nr:hypothetical protein [Acidimicrobiales bacterium]